jgi:hypothetical protein
MQRDLMSQINEQALTDTSAEFATSKAELQDFVNQGALAHRTASSQEEWENLWGMVLTKHNMQGVEGLVALVYTAEEDRTPALHVIN